MNSAGPTPKVSPAMLPDARWLAAAVLILVVAFGLRAWRIDGGYRHYDEVIAVQASQHLSRTESWDVNWRIAVPAFSFADQYNFSAYLYATHFFRRTIKAVDSNERWRVHDGLIAHRFFSVWCGTAVVAIAMVIGRRCGGAAVALAAGALVATNPQLIQDSHYARPEAFMTLLTVAVIWISLSGVTWRRLALAGFLTGLATATKVNNLMLLTAPALALIVTSLRGENREKNSPWRAVSRGCAILGIAGIAGWVTGVPFAVIHWAEYLSGLAILRGQYASSHPPHSFPDYRSVWSLLREYYVTTHGWPLLVAIPLGMVWLARRRAYLVLALLAMPLLGSVILFGSQRVFFERNLSQVLPGALLLGAAGVMFLFAFLPRGGARWTAIVLALGAVSLPGFRVLALFLGPALSGVDERELHRFREQLSQAHPGIRVATGSLYSQQEFVWLQGELLAGQGELLYILMDFNDAYKPWLLPELFARFHVVPVGEHDGTFADYPPSALNSFHGPRYLAYRIRSR